jgi:hypothetical protein
MKVKDLVLKNGIDSFQLKGLENGLTSNFSVTLDMSMTVQVYNPNRYHMKADSVDVNAFIDANYTQLNQGPGAMAIVGGTTQSCV